MNTTQESDFLLCKRKKNVEGVKTFAFGDGTPQEYNANGANLMLHSNRKNFWFMLRRLEKPELSKWSEMPKHLQFNPYVLSGYRPIQNTWECLFSLVHLHNETVNILTHGISVVFILAVLPGLLPWNSSFGVRFLALCHFIGTLAPWCGSFVYHLFMNHQSGAKLYYTLLQIDMIGIWVTQSFGALPMVSSTVYCAPFLVRWSLLVIYCTFCVYGLYKAMTAWSPWERRLCFALPFCMRTILAASRLAHIGGGDPHTFLHVFLQDAVSLAGGIIGATQFPEKMFPGRFDYCFNSHNIMHVMVLMAVYSMHQVTMKDLAWLSHTECKAPLLNL